MARMVLADIAFARAGDKGNIADIGVIAPAGPRMDAVYEVLVREVTADRVAELFGDFVQGPVERYELPRIRALKLVLHDALGGGGPSSLRADNLGKALGGAVMRLPIEVPDDLAAALGPRPHPPRDPYAEAAWRVV